MVKERFDIVASSLGSYFGVGFNTVEEQQIGRASCRERV